MFSLLKRYFIPHEQNDHKPYFLRTKAFVVFLVLIIAVETLFLGQIMLIVPFTDLFAVIVPGVLVDLANGSRAAESVPPLQTNTLLEEAAKAKAQDMAAKGYFAHTSPDNVTPWHWLDKVGYSYRYAGENLAVRFYDSQDVHNAWMRSPTHEENILNDHFTEIGIGTASGAHEGRAAIFIVQFFGQPLSKTGRVSAVPAVALSENIPPEPLPEEVVAEVESVLIEETEAVAEVKFVQNKETEAVVAGSSASPVKDTHVQGDTMNIEVLAKEEVKDVLPVQAASVHMTPRSSLFERVATKPNTAMKIFYGVLFAVALFALALKILVKIRIQHPLLIMRGIILLFAISALLAFNHSLVDFSGSVL